MNNQRVRVLAGMTVARATIAFAVFVALAATGVAANAAVVDFGSSNDGGNAATTFADGSFSSNLSGIVADGFYSNPSFAEPSTTAYNGYGQNGESIYFNSPQFLASLTVAKCSFCLDVGPTSFTATAYNGLNQVVGTQTVGASYTPSVLTFDISGISAITLTFAGGSDAYEDGRSVAWYEVSDVRYGVSAVPLPAALPLLGGALAGLGAFGQWRKRRRNLAA